MDEETQKIIAEQLKTLPKDVKEAIISVDYKTKLQEITQRQKLLIDQAGKLEMETTLVMIGLEPLADFVGNIEREMNVPALRAKDIAMDVSENIFKPIRMSLQKMNEAVAGEEEVEEPAAPRFTDTNEINLNRDQILSEIENPVPNRQPATLTSSEIEIPPKQEVEVKPVQNLMESKLSDITITTKQIVNAVPEVKLPEIKKRPSSGIDPYRESLS